MVLADQADAGFHNESKGHSRVDTHIYLSENDPEPRWNRPVLTIAQIIKFVMTSAEEAELGALFIMAEEMINLRQTLSEMGCPQPPPPVQTDKYTAEGVINNTTFQRNIKSMDL